MNLVDYTGKLNDHDEYIKILNKLENKCQYIEYVLIDDDEVDFINRFSGLIISTTMKTKWWGTKSSGKSKIYRLKASQEIFKYLRQFETFCKYVPSNLGDVVEDTNFGINDIAFFDEKEIPLLFTTTHEGFITIRQDLLK